MIDHEVLIQNPTSIALGGTAGAAAYSHSSFHDDSNVFPEVTVPRPYGRQRRRASMGSVYMGESQRRSSLDLSERHRDGRRVSSFCRNLREKLQELNTEVQQGSEDRHGSEDQQEWNPNRPKQQSPSKRTLTSNAGSKVRFQGQEHQVIGPPIKSLSDMTESEKDAIWWQRAELEEIKRSIDAASSDLFQASERLPDSYSMAMKRVYEKCCTSAALDDQDLLSHRERTELTTWTHVALSRRGLEYSSIPFLAEARKQNREKAIHSVISLQKRMKTFDPESKCDSLRTFSEKRTLAPRLFARLLAQADATALTDQGAPTGPRRARRRFSM